MSMHRISSMMASCTCCAVLLLGLPAAHAESKVAAPTSKEQKPVSRKTDFEMQMHAMQTAHDKMVAAATPSERHAALEESTAQMRQGMGMLHDHVAGNACMPMGMGKHQRDMMAMMMRMMDQQAMMMRPGMAQ